MIEYLYMAIEGGHGDRRSIDFEAGERGFNNQSESGEKNPYKNFTPKQLDQEKDRVDLILIELAGKNQRGNYTAQINDWERTKLDIKDAIERKKLLG
jgi:hypothetical protein